MIKTDKLNLWRSFNAGHLVEKEGGFTLNQFKGAAMDIDFLAKYYDVADNSIRKKFEETVTRDIIMTLRKDGQQMFYADPKRPGFFITFAERHSSKEIFEAEKFYDALLTAVRFIPKGKDKLQQLLMDAIAELDR